VARAILRGVVVAAVLWSVATAFGATFSFHFGWLRLTSRDPVRPMALAAIATVAYLLLFGATAFRREMENLARIPARASRFVPLGLVLLTLGLGLRWSTYVAGGSDCYGYVSQADLWLDGHLRVQQPWAAQFEWPVADWTFAPLGYRPGTEPHTIVPTYSAGVSMLMALGKTVAGTKGPYLVVPLLGALCVWLTCRLGRKLAGELEGSIAALLLATSPAFLYSLMFPMADVAAMTFWTLAALLILAERRAWLFVAGLAASMAILVRPNVVPVVALLGLGVALQKRPGGFRMGALVADLAVFVAGVVPGVLSVAALNAYLYGGPLTSGYGTAQELYVLARGLPNLQRYGQWFWETQPAVIVLALVGLLLPGAFARRADAPGSDGLPPKMLLAGLTVTVVACYVFYLTFDAWWYLRFLLPAFPAVMILAAAGLSRVARLLPREGQVALLAIVLTAAVASQSRTAIDRGVYDLQAGEYRYISTARAVEARVPASAMVICMQHSGSLRYYGHRLTLRWDWLPPEWLDRAVASLRAHGYRPYVLLEDWEVPRFRERFAGSEVGRLLDKPIAVVSPGVALYDPVHD
jgi:hypothetical protein